MATYDFVDLKTMEMSIFVRIVKVDRRLKILEQKPTIN